MDQTAEQEFHAGDANEANDEQASESHTPRAEADLVAGEAKAGDGKRKSRKIKKAQRKSRSTSRTRLPTQESDSNLPEQHNYLGISAQTNSDENNAEEQILVAQPQAIVQPLDELLTQAASTAENFEHSAADFAEKEPVVVKDASVPQPVEDEKPDETETGADRHDAQPQEENNIPVTDTTAVNEADQNGSEQVVRNCEDANQPAEQNEPATTSNTANVYPHPPRAPRRSKSAKQRVAARKPPPENEGEQQNEEEQPSRPLRPGSAKGKRLVPSASREQRLESKYGELHGLLTQEFLVNTDDLIERQVRETKQLLQNYISTQRIVAHSESRHHVLQDRHEDASEWPEGRHARAFREAQQAKVKVHVQTSTSDADSEEGNKRLLRRSQTQAQSLLAPAPTRSKAEQPASLNLESGSYPSTKPPLNRKNKENNRARTASAHEPHDANLLVGYGLEVEESKRSKRSDNYLGHTDNPVVMKWLRAKNKQLHNQRDSELRQQREQMLLERFQQEQAEERKHAANAAYKKWLHEINMRQNTARARIDCKLDLSSPDDGDGDCTKLNSLRLEPFDDSNPHVLTSEEFSDEDEAVRDARIKARKVCHNYVFKHPLPPYRVKSGVSFSKCNTVRFKIRGQASSLQSSRPASTMPSTSRERTAIVSKSSISSETMALVRQAQRYSASGVIATAKSRRPQSAAVNGSNDAGDNATSQSSRVFRPMHPKLSFDEWLQRQLQLDSQRQELALRLHQRNAASEGESERRENGEPEVLLEQPQMMSHASNESEPDNGRGDDDSADLPSAQPSAQVIPEVQDENESRAARSASPVLPPSIPLSDADDEYYSDLPV